MGVLIKNRDYAVENGALVYVSGAEEVLNRVLFLLTARRGSFPFLPELGSRLSLLRSAKPAQWESLAKLYVTEALSGETELAVTGVRVRREEEQLWVETDLEWNGQTLRAELDVGESL